MLGYTRNSRHWIFRTFGFFDHGNSLDVLRLCQYETGVHKLSLLGLAIWDSRTSKENVSVSSRGAKPRERETGSLQVAHTMRLVLLNVSLHVLVIKSLQETQ